MGLKDNLKYKRIFNLTLQNNFKIRRFLIFSIISSNPQRTHFLNYKACAGRSISNVVHCIKVDNSIIISGQNIQRKPYTLMLYLFLLSIICRNENKIIARTT